MNWLFSPTFHWARQISRRAAQGRFGWHLLSDPKSVIALDSYAAIIGRLWPHERGRATEVKPDTSAIARIRAYLALTMVERYGKHGP